MGQETVRKKSRRKEDDELERQSDAERAEEVLEKGDEIEEELDRLDEIIEEALGDEEDEAERKAQEFVDGFKQDGGQ